MFDYHMHSEFSADCDTPMERTIEKAIELGLKEICFTDHMDYDYPDKDWTFEFNLQEYDQKIKQMQATYHKQITIKKGIEIGLQPHVLTRYEKLMDEEAFDFIIASMHATEGKDLHSGAFFDGKTIDESFEVFYNELLTCIKEYKEFSVLGHLDLLKRYATEKPTHDFHDIIQEIFKEIIPAGKGIEINTSGFSYGTNAMMPSPDILQWYKECGGEIITLGSDSHVEHTLTNGFQKAISALEEVGFKYIATFTAGKPEFHAIKRLNLNE